MKKKDELINTFKIANKIDNIPVLLDDIDVILDNFEFALRIDPYLFIQLLTYSNNVNYGFAGKIFRIEEIPLLIENNILKAILKSNSCLDIKKTWYKEAAFSFLLYPVYLTLSEIFMDTDWLSEKDINCLTFMPVGLTLKKIFFPLEYEKIKTISIYKNISMLESENQSNNPSFILLTNIYFSIKNIPLIIPYYHNNKNLENTNQKINFVITLTDIFLQSNIFIKPELNENISYYFNPFMTMNIDFYKWYDILLEKTGLLWKNLINEELKNNLIDTLKYCFEYHNGKIKEGLKIKI